MTHGPLGIHAGVWGFDWSAPGAERAISGAARAGFDLIEIPAPDLATVDVTVTTRLLSHYGIRGSVSLALDASSDINSLNPTTSAAGEARLMAAVSFAHQIGASFVGGVVYSAMRRYDVLPTAEARSNSLDVLRRVAHRAADVGVTLGIEYVNRYESNLLNTVDQTLAYLDELDVPNAVIHLDTFHAHIEETDIAHAIERAGARLGYIHASESHRGILGTGSIQWDRVVDALETATDRSPIVVETFSPAVISPTESVDIALWQTTWRDPDALAQDSHRFLSDRLSRTTALSGATK